MIHVQCLVCAKVFSVEESDEVVLVVCPECGQPFDLEQFATMVDADAVTTPPPPEPAPIPSEPELLSFTPKAASATRFVPLPYRPEGGVAWLRLPLFLLQILLAGAVLGWLAGRIGEHLYLILLYPLILGLLLAGFLFVGNSWAKIRNPTLAGVLGALGGGMAILTMHFGDAQRYQRHVVREEPKLSPEQRLKLYLQTRAKQGLTITGGEEAGIELGPTGTWGYWCLELLLVMSLAYFGGRQGAKEPFCAVCRRWKQERRLGTVSSTAEDVLPLMRQGNLEALREHHPSSKEGNLVLIGSVCPNCAEREPIDIRLVLRSRTEKSYSSETEVGYWTFPGEALPALDMIFSESISSSSSEAA